MKFAVLFSVTAVFLTTVALRKSGFYLVLIWPALSSAIVAISYFSNSPALFGKKPNGTIYPWPALVLLPYLIFIWFVWHIIRIASNEPSSHPLVPGIRIGRRLLARELDEDVRLVVDLTCEFIEPKRIREARDYKACPVLDASIPTEEQAIQWARDIVAHQAGILIHCAQGHGRTGTLAAVLLLIQGTAKTADEAIQLVQGARPRLRLNRKQTDFVHRIEKRLSGDMKLN